MKKVSLYVLATELMIGVAAIGCNMTQFKGEVSKADTDMVKATSVDTLIFVSEAEVDSSPFIILKMNQETVVVTLG